MCWDLSNTLSAMGIFVSIVSIGIALHIYNGWTKQKQKELAANCAEILIEKIETLRQGIVEADRKNMADKENVIDSSFIEDMEETKVHIKYYLSKLKKLSENVSENNKDLAYKNLVYEQYINLLSELILTLKENPKSIGERNKVYLFLSRTNDLFCQLADISLYIWK